MDKTPNDNRTDYYSPAPDNYTQGNDNSYYNQNPNGYPDNNAYSPNLDNQYYTTTTTDVPGQGMATASLVLGILSLIMAWMGWFSILAFVLAIIGVYTGSRARRMMPVGTGGRATAGMVFSIIAIVISVIAFIASLWFYNTYGGYWDFYNYYYW